MKWLEVHIDTNHAGLDGLVAFLSSQGIAFYLISPWHFYWRTC